MKKHEELGALSDLIYQKVGHKDWTSGKWDANKDRHPDLSWDCTWYPTTNHPGKWALSSSIEVQGDIFRIAVLNYGGGDTHAVWVLHNGAPRYPGGSFSRVNKLPTEPVMVLKDIRWWNHLWLILTRRDLPMIEVAQPVCWSSRVSKLLRDGLKANGPITGRQSYIDALQGKETISVQVDPTLAESIKEVEEYVKSMKVTVYE